jgi:alcohol dehydrogenase (cytochrome c)
MKREVGGAVILVLLALCAGPRLCGQGNGSKAGSALDVGTEDLLITPVGENWPSYNGDYSGRRFSSLRQINRNNVGQLRAAWVFHPGNSQRLEATPVVVRGVMYLTSANDVFALDARTGRTLWHYSRPISAGLLDDAAAHKSRGVAVWEQFVYSETDDAHLLCLDARSGNLLWDVQYADKVKQYGATSVPLVVKDEVIVGTSGGDSGVRGFVAAFDAKKGALRWKLWTIPGPGEFGSESWPGDLYLHGGATTWMPGTYDPELDTVYWTTSNAAPDFDGSSRPGDDLYTACVLAIDPNTGKLKWYFQFTPHDVYDYDANETPVLVDQEESGTTHHLLLQANRNGFFYVLDRSNGKFLRAAPFVERLNWATGIDASGRPRLSGKVPTKEGTRICPGIVGATNWFSPSYNPNSGLFYVMALENCNLYFSTPKPFTEGETFYGTGTKHPVGEDSRKVLLAISPSDGKLVWKYPQIGRGNSWGGTLSTAGGLVFFADDAESFEAVDAETGRALWHFNTGQSFSASPMTYAVDGVQFVAIAAGSDVFTFTLPQ